jgi:hypothetical protein
MKNILVSEFVQFAKNCWDDKCRTAWVVHVDAWVQEIFVSVAKILREDLPLEM